ncbi:MAG: thioredoxin domain-containing protein [Cellvibrionaceae bacterium]|nr:thioredoxin domain-containing protein [Cellvibrionaceae bacterium]
MKSLCKPQWVLMFFAVIASLGLVIGTYSVYQVHLLLSEVEVLSEKVGFENLLDEDEQRVNDYVDNRIDIYVDRWKRQKIAKTLDAYKLANEQVKGEDYVYGSEDARFTLMEFSDLECPYCKRFHETPKKIVDISEGMVNWKWKHLPLQFHNPAAFKGAHAAECVGSIEGNRAFWVYLDQVFDATRGNGQGVNDLGELAAKIGVDEQQFLTCANSGRFVDKINRDLALAKERHITSTPVTLVIDTKTGKRVQLRGAQSAEAILSTIQRIKKLSDAD